MQPDVTITAADGADSALIERFARSLLVELGPGLVMRLHTNSEDGENEPHDFRVERDPDVKPQCRFCRKTLRHERTSVDENGRWNPEIRRPMWNQPGYSGNGRFCTKSCAARWAVYILGGDINF